MDVADMPLERLEAEITGLNAHLSAATCRWLLLLSEFDRREGWATWGCRNCAHYLGLACGIDRRTAREQVRVARRLTDLPVTREAFARGDLSYSKVRAIARVATPENEGALVEWARYGTASHLERIVRGYGGVLRSQEREAVNERHVRRHLRWHWDDDGSLVVSGRLDPEAGAVLIAAVEAELGGSAEPPSQPREDADTRRADALVAVAEAAMAARRSGQEGPRPNVPEVVVHVDIEVLADDGDGRCEVADGQPLAPETARRLACKAGIVTVVEDGEENPLDVGRRRRTPSSALRRALESRDGHTCRYPGCDARRFLHAHHVRHWARNGETTLENLVLMCSRCHRLVHEGGFRCELSDMGEVVFLRPDGRHVGFQPCVVPPLVGWREADSRLGLDLAPDAGLCLWGGEKLDLGLAVDCLLGLDGTAA